MTLNLLRYPEAASLNASEFGDRRDRSGPVALRSPQGEYMAIAESGAQPSPDAPAPEPVETSLWQDVAQACATSNGTPDPIAMEIIYRFQKTFRPIATMLFGSRARGDHRATSDIDIILVDPHPRWRQNESPLTIIDDLVESHYERPVHADIHYFSWNQYARFSECGNIFLADALLNGIVFGLGMGDYPDYDRNRLLTKSLSISPEDFVSSYASDNPPPPKYNWAEYNEFLRWARSARRIMHIMNTGEIPPGRVDKDTRAWGEVCAKSVRKPEDPEKTVISSREGQNAMRYTLAALHLANKGHMQRKSDEFLSYLLRMLDDRLSSSGISPMIPWTTYASHDILRKIPREELIEGVQSDTQALRKLAGSLRRTIDGTRRRYEQALPREESSPRRWRHRDPPASQ